MLQSIEQWPKRFSPVLVLTGLSLLILVTTYLESDGYIKMSHILLIVLIFVTLGYGYLAKHEVWATKRMASQTQRALEEKCRLLKQSEAVQESILHKLECTNRDLEQLTYIASHDLRAPLRAIKNLASWVVEDEGEKLSGESCENLVLLQSRVTRLDNFLCDILEYSRIGRNEDFFEEFDCTQSLLRAVELIEIPESFQVEVSSLQLRITASRTALEVVARNLVENAIKHHSENKGKIEIGFDLGQEEVIISVADNGPGIPVSEHDRVFDLFTTLRSRDESEATGMGLSICRKTLERIGGNIWLDKEYSQGARVLFSVPVLSKTGNSTLSIPSVGR